MSYSWIPENPPHWDEQKEAILGAAPEGAFELDRYREGDIVPGDWWRVEERDRVVGYGWMDCTWGDAEILLAVAPDMRGRGIGAFIIEQLEREAASRGLNYLYNCVRTAHAEGPAVTRWLERHGFRGAADGVLRRSVQVPRSGDGGP